MKDFIMSFPVWFWMIMIAAVILPLSYRLFRKGIKLTFKNKIVGEAIIDAEDDVPVKAVEPEPVVEVEKAEEK